MDKRRGSLLHGNEPGDPSQAPRCGAQTRNGSKCQAPAMRSSKTGKYTRCRMHGGASTGPRTADGLERCRQARWKDGTRSAVAIAERKRQKTSRPGLLIVADQPANFYAFSLKPARGFGTRSKKRVQEPYRHGLS